MEEYIIIKVGPYLKYEDENDAIEAMANKGYVPISITSAVEQYQIDDEEGSLIHFATGSATTRILFKKQ